MTAYPGQTWTTLGQLCAALWDSQSQSDVIQPGFAPGTVVTPLALRCSALDRCATREPSGTRLLFLTVTLWIRLMSFFTDSVLPGSIIRCNITTLEFQIFYDSVAFPPSHVDDDVRLTDGLAQLDELHLCGHVAHGPHALS